MAAHRRRRSSWLAKTQASVPLRDDAPFVTAFLASRSPRSAGLLLALPRCPAKQQKPTEAHCRATHLLHRGPSRALAAYRLSSLVSRFSSPPVTPPRERSPKKARLGRPRAHPSQLVHEHGQGCCGGGWAWVGTSSARILFGRRRRRFGQGGSSCRRCQMEMDRSSRPGSS